MLIRGVGSRQRGARRGAAEDSGGSVAQGMSGW